AVAAALTEGWANPSSVHAEGRAARRLVEEAREEVAALVGASPREIVFTSGGTEADNLAVLGVARLAREEGRGDHVVASRVEHHAVLEACQQLEREGFRITWLPVDGNGLVDPDDLRRALRPGTVLVSVMLGNNEVGAVQAVRELAAIAREAGVPFHTDGVQAVGHLPVNVDELGVDLLALSSHKIYGPKGVGALYVRSGTRLAPLQLGGGQERRLRPGTENVPGIVGLGRAAALARQGLAADMAHARRLRDRLEDGLLAAVEGVRLNGPERGRRLPHVLNVSFQGVDGEALLLNLDLEGIAASSGSACAAGSIEPSHVLLAMGVPRELAQAALRLTVGRFNTEEDIDAALEVIPRVVQRLRSRRGGGGRVE
ncbi:MAG: cysteine desulfurase, partial [Clostridia bacterium]|nr:cysteine desulfurase [Clostridia bacterium]